MHYVGGEFWRIRQNSTPYERGTCWFTLSFSLPQHVEKSKAILPTPVQTDRTALSRGGDDKLGKVITAIEVFTSEIQQIMTALSEHADVIAEEDLSSLVDQLEKVDELSDVASLDGVDM